MRKNLASNYRFEFIFLIIGLFIANWVLSTLIYKLRRYDKLGEQEVKAVPEEIAV